MTLCDKSVQCLNQESVLYSQMYLTCCSRTQFQKFPFSGRSKHNILSVCFLPLCRLSNLFCPFTSCYQRARHLSFCHFKAERSSTVIFLFPFQHNLTPLSEKQEVSEAFTPDRVFYLSLFFIVTSLARDVSWKQD